MFEGLTRFGFSLAHAAAQSGSVRLVCGAYRVVQISLQLRGDQRGLGGGLRRLRRNNFDLPRLKEVSVVLPLRLQVRRRLNVRFHIVHEFMRIRFNLQVFHIVSSWGRMLLPLVVLVVDGGRKHGILPLSRGLSRCDDTEHAFVVIAWGGFIMILIFFIRLGFLFFKLW